MSYKLYMCSIIFVHTYTNINFKLIKLLIQSTHNSISTSTLKKLFFIEQINNIFKHLNRTVVLR